MAKKAVQPVKDMPAEEMSQEEPETPEFALNGSQPKTQADMVRAAIAAGHDKPSEGTAWIKQQFGFEIGNFSATKAQLKNRSKGPGEARTAPRTQAPVQSGGIPAGFGSDVKELRELIEKVGGAEELNELIGQLSGLLGKYGVSGLSEIIEAIG